MVCNLIELEDKPTLVHVISISSVQWVIIECIWNLPHLSFWCDCFNHDQSLERSCSPMIVGPFRWLGPDVWWEISQIWIEHIKPIGQMSDGPWKIFGYTDHDSNDIVFDRQKCSYDLMAFARFMAKWKVGIYSWLICGMLMPYGIIGLQWMTSHQSLDWRHNECNGISNHRHLDCLLNRLFMCRSKKTSKLFVTGLCEEVTSEFPTQRASNTENVVSIWWCHHDWGRHLNAARWQCSFHQ